MNKSMYSSSKTDWETPQWLFDELNKEFRFDYDICATSENKKCKNFVDIERNALSITWYGRLWMNPPYGDPDYVCKPNCKNKKCVVRGFCNTQYIPGVADWIEKAHHEAQTGNCTVVALLPARTDTAWFHDYCTRYQVRFFRGRINFVGGKHGATFPSMLVIFNKYSSGVKFIDIKKQAGVTK